MAAPRATRTARTESTEGSPSSSSSTASTAASKRRHAAASSAVPDTAVRFSAAARSRCCRFHAARAAGSGGGSGGAALTFAAAGAGAATAAGLGRATAWPAVRRRRLAVSGSSASASQWREVDGVEESSLSQRGHASARTSHTLHQLRGRDRNGVRKGWRDNTGGQKERWSDAPPAPPSRAAPPSPLGAPKTVGPAVCPPGRGRNEGVNDAVGPRVRKGEAAGVQGGGARRQPHTSAPNDLGRRVVHQGNTSCGPVVHPGAAGSSDPQQSQKRRRPVPCGDALSWSAGASLALTKPTNLAVSPPVQRAGWRRHASGGLFAGSNDSLHLGESGGGGGRRRGGGAAGRASSRIAREALGTARDSCQRHVRRSDLDSAAVRTQPGRSVDAAGAQRRDAAAQRRDAGACDGNETRRRNSSQLRGRRPEHGRRGVEEGAAAALQ